MKILEQIYNQFTDLEKKALADEYFSGFAKGYNEMLEKRGGWLDDIGQTSGQWLNDRYAGWQEYSKNMPGTAQWLADISAKRLGNYLYENDKSEISKGSLEHQKKLDPNYTPPKNIKVTKETLGNKQENKEEPFQNIKALPAIYGALIPAGFLLGYHALKNYFPAPEEPDEEVSPKLKFLKKTSGDKTWVSGVPLVGPIADFLWADQDPMTPGQKATVGTLGTLGMAYLALKAKDVLQDRLFTKDKKRYE